MDRRFFAVVTAFLLVQTGCGSEGGSGVEGFASVDAAGTTRDEGADLGQGGDRGEEADAVEETGPSCDALQCEAGGACFDEGDAHPEHPCMSCAMDGAEVAWAYHAGPCDDGDLCTVGDSCIDGSCVPGTEALACDDGEQCTEDSCDPVVGCVNTAIGGSCDDGSACTESDACVDGACVGSPVTCFDDNECTTDSCNPATGCKFTPIIDFECCPAIDVDFPARAATVLGESSPDIVITGAVHSAAGDVDWLTVNGEEVIVTPGTGEFAHPYSGQVGANTLTRTTRWR